MLHIIYLFSYFKVSKFSGDYVKEVCSVGLHYLSLGSPERVSRGRKIEDLVSSPVKKISDEVNLFRIPFKRVTLDTFFLGSGHFVSYPN